MSTIRDPAYITDAGRTMMTAGGDVTYTKAVLYGQDISHLTSDQVKALTTIGSPLREVKVGISDKQNTDRGTTVILEATFQNDNLKADLPYTAVGFFAQKGNDEKLIAVAVANAGAYLTATSPDGVATDALDLKLAIAIGDATNVTATVDPAGSVTPATLNGAINKATHDLTAQIDTKADKADVTAQFATKADKTTVEQELAIKANSTDIDKKLDTKANSSDVYTKKQVDDAFSSRDATIASKADKATVDAEISKIDFTPYAKTADVNKEIKTVTDLANTKVDATYSYSKAELDKKLLAISTDADGKVNATQVASMIADKVDKTYVDNQIATIDFGKIKFRKQYVNSDGQTADKTWSATKNKDGTYTIDLWQDDWTASKLYGVLAQLPNKADTSAVNAQIADAKNTIKSNVDNLQSAINTKASQADVDKQIKDINDAVATKADKATVDAEISKIDFTPYAKTADVNKEIKTVTDLANTKVDATYSYSKAELDKKLLAISTDADGKVNATQVASMIADKVDKTYVDNQIATIDFGKIKFRKQYVNSDGQTADKTWSATKNKDGTYTIDLWQDDWTASKLYGVLAQLPNKADTSAVNAQIADAKNTIKSNVDNLQSAINTKASQADFDSLKTLVNNVKGFNVDSFKGSIPTTDINKITDSGLYGFANQTLANSPFSGNRWGLLFVLREYDNDANNIDQFITSNGNLYWRNISLTNSIYPSWKRFANDGDINSLQSAINTKANSSDLTALDKKAVKSVGIYPNNLHFDSGGFNYWSGEVKASPDANGYALIDLTDDTSVRAAADQLNVMLTGLNHLQGKQTKDSADANALSETGVYYCSSPAKNFPVGQWGTLVTSNGNGARASQFYFPDDNSAVWFRTLDGEWRGWVRLANIDDVNNAESSLTSLINAVSNKVNVTVPLFRRITAANTWNDILGASNGDTPVLVSIRDEGGANTLGNYSAAVAFGGGDTKGVLNVAYSDHTARIIGGNGNAPVWHEDIAWKSDISNLQNIINQQNQTIQSLTTRLTNAENEIRYIKANYVEGRTFPASQEAQANSWENANPQRIAFITK